MDRSALLAEASSEANSRLTSDDKLAGKLLGESSYEAFQNGYLGLGSLILVALRAQPACDGWPGAFIHEEPH
jgi:hypothetical protein